MKKEFDLSLYLVTNQEAAKDRDLLYIVEQALDSGVTIVQFREKLLSPDKIIPFGKKLHALTECFGVPLIVNDYPDIAIAIGAEGVHVGQEDLAVAKARQMLGANYIIGASASTVTEAIKAQADGADYIGAGPIFPTRTKKDAGIPIGITTLHDIVKAVTLPVVAIGGINEKNVRDTLHTGAHGVAVISAIIAANDPSVATRRLHKIILLELSTRWKNQQ